MAAVKYLVKKPCFVNGRRYRPAPDGRPVHVTARAGLEGAALDAVEKTAVETPLPAELLLVHRGRGSYSIMRDGREIIEGLSKEDGEAKLAEMKAAEAPTPAE